jgi:hypothetical protein
MARLELEQKRVEVEAAGRQLEATSRQLEAQEDRLTRLEADNTRHFSHDSLPWYFKEILPSQMVTFFKFLRNIISGPSLRKKYYPK